VSGVVWCGGGAGVVEWRGGGSVVDERVVV